MNRTAWIIIAAACVLGLGALVVSSKKDDVNIDALNPSSIILSENGSIGDRVFGNANAKVIVFEYADFQCPGCAGAFTNTSAIQKLYKDQVAFVFRHFPLTTIHPNALASATVAEAAGQQGKFWEMHDLLFEQREGWVNLTADQRGAVFLGYVTQLGLDVEKFKTDQASKIVSEKISRDQALGGKLNVNSTPSFFVGTAKADEKTVEDMIQSKGEKFMDMIDAALKAAGETPPIR